MYFITDLSRITFVYVTSCYELEMLDEHTASGPLFNLLICNRTPPPNKSTLQKNLIISHSLVYNNIMVHKNIDEKKIFIKIRCRYSEKFDIVPNYQCNKANNLLQVMRQWRSVYQAIRAVQVATYSRS